MLRVGLTGGIGSGKTEVSRLFSLLGTKVIDTDIISRDLVTPGSIALAEIIDLFGQNMLQPDGNLDRQQMRELVFKNEKARKALEDILHPLIMQEVSRQVSQADSVYVIIVIPLMFETGLQTAVDRVLVIDTPEELQRKRVMQRDSIDEPLFEKIVASQASRQARLSIADDVILNDADLGTLKQQVMELHQQYERLSQEQP